MERIAVLASGGDAPGMNACLRAVVRTAIRRGLKVLGVRDGYAGLLNGDLASLGSRDVSNIVQRGGVFLGSARSEEFRTVEGRAQAAVILKDANVDGLVAVGGDGTARGAAALSREWGVKTIVIPGTIDNDLPGTDYSIGFDTAVNIAMEACDRLRDTAEALERIFFVEVMGRYSGALALEVGLASGADAVLVPEEEVSVTDVIAHLQKSIDRGARSLLVIVAEGDEVGGAFALAERVKPHIKRDSRVAILGHIQRGGPPTARDRVLAARLGVGAVDALLRGVDSCLIGEIGGELVCTPIDEVVAKKKLAPMALVEVVSDLA